MATVKYWEAVGRAWRQMVDILFHPFNFEKWMVMGFAAWFAGLNAGGGVSSGNPFSSLSNSNSSHNMGETIQQIWVEYGTLIVSIVSGVLLFLVAFGILFSWVHARGKFVFLDNVIHRRGAIVEPWKKYRKQGNSLFLWSLAVGFISFFLLLFILAISISMAWSLFTNQTNISLGIVGLVVGVVGVMLYLLYFGYLYLFVYDFVLPLMMKYDEKIQSGWHRFSALYREQKGAFLLYGLVRYLLSMAVGMALLIIGLLSCCTLFLASAIPYIGTVIMLPVFVFYRLVSLEFIRQFGDEFDVESNVILSRRGSVPSELAVPNMNDRPINEEPINQEPRDFTDDSLVS